jgi:hypothetical protein
MLQSIGMIGFFAGIMGFGMFCIAVIGLIRGHVDMAHIYSRKDAGRRMVVSGALFIVGFATIAILGAHGK